VHGRLCQRATDARHECDGDCCVSPTARVAKVSALGYFTGTESRPSGLRARVGSIQQGPRSALSIGQQGGITAGTVNLGPPPLKLQYSFRTLSDNDTATFGFDRTKCPVVSHIRIVPNQSVPPLVSVALDFDQPVTEIATTIEGVNGHGGWSIQCWFPCCIKAQLLPGIGPHNPLIVEVCSSTPVSLKGGPHLVN
jgi:hypothetical protein